MTSRSSLRGHSAQIGAHAAVSPRRCSPIVPCTRKSGTRQISSPSNLTLRIELAGRLGDLKLDGRLALPGQPHHRIGRARSMGHRAVECGDRRRRQATTAQNTSLSTLTYALQAPAGPHPGYARYPEQTHLSGQDSPNPLTLHPCGSALDTSTLPARLHRYPRSVSPMSPMTLTSIRRNPHGCWVSRESTGVNEVNPVFY
jgi:hypothetical protein